MANPYLIDALRRRARNLVSLDAPTDESLDETLTDLALGFVPVVGTAQAGRDFERSRRDNDKLGMVLSAAAGIPVVGGVAKAINTGRKTEAVVNALRDTSKNKKLVDVFNRQARYEIDSANKRILNVQSNPDTPLLEHKQITDLSDLDQIKDPIFNYPKAQVLKEIGEQNGFNVKVQGSNVSDSVYAKFYKEDDNGMFDFKVRISDHADVSRNTPAGEIKAYDINPDSSGSMEEIIKLLNDPNWLNKFYTSD